MPRCQRHADADRQAVAERTGRGLDARHLAALRVAAEDPVPGGRTSSARPSGKIALVGEHGVEREAAVPLAQDAAVARAPLRLLRAVAQHVVVEDAQISSGDIEEPTWPRSPPASASTMRRRR